MFPYWLRYLKDTHMWNKAQDGAGPLLGARNTASSSPLKDEDHEYKDWCSSRTSPEPTKVPKTMHVPRSIRAHVDLPHAGTSYNPRVEDHQALLEKASSAELARLNKEKALRKAAALPKHETRATEETDMQEMMEGLFDTSDNNDLAESAATDDDDNLAKSIPVKQKTKAQRRRAALEKKMKAHLEKEKQNRLRENDVYRLKRIKKEIKKAEELSKKRRERKQLLRVKKLMGPARIGPYKFEPAEEDFLLSKELPKSLRHLKPEGSILADRYKNLQLRNIIESRVRIKKKRRRPYKYLEKNAVRCVDEHYIPDNPLGISNQ
ncbi:glioma tumor suppressor candidate region protein [Trichuris trichiura]|uniref:Ribosome biogenesis protein NOP53 n=1 Tax=Trichuris trichiura TaxID=36087 RepID=A0A077ZE02_TRITR|nr:glioma tumor suppressor candidate region protein [Trichuris trichiura]